ncbi:central tail hub [Pseudoxanthomonas phage PW916]|nr:central tail hub [Pseudoxanthomonas phage PW916]
MWAAIVIIVIALLLVLAAPKPKIENARAANLGDFQFPRSKEGDPVPWFLGTVRLKSPNSLWYGDYTPVPIKKKQKTGLFSSKKVTVGYKYHVGLDLCWCLAGDDTVELLRLWSDKHTFFQGSLTTQSSITVNLPNLFGGEEQRGGLVGTIDFYPGRFVEERNAYLAQKASPDVPAYVGQCRTVFRGSASTLASGFYFGTTTSVNAISAEMRRLSRKVHATYSVMPNGFDVNPMEFMYAAFTEKFGMPGTSTDDIDLPSWQACAEQLYNEGLGMSLLVQQGVTGKDLAEEALRIADGILYQDDESGKIIARLIREDYVVGDLPIFDQSVVKELVSFNKTTWEQTYNQCRVTFKDRANEYADKAATAQDFANINFQQRVKNTDISVPGCFVNDEANQLAVRQLSLLSVPLFQIEIRCNRKASLMKPGDLFVFEYAPYGITNMVMRIQRIDKGLLTDGVVTINAVQDRFATALAVFAPPGGSGWVPIGSDAAPVVSRRIEEVPYWFAQFADTAPANDQGMLMALAVPPTSASVEFDADYTTGGDSGFTNPIRILEDAPYYGSGLLTAAYADTVGRTSGTDATGFTLELVSVPASMIDSNGTWDTTGQMLLLVDNEYMSAANITDNGNGTYTFSGIRRALLDTDFETHALGARVYFVQQADGLLESYFNDASSWRVRLIDNTPTSTLDPAVATQNTVAMTRRMFRPAPPDYVTISGSRAPGSVATGTTVTVAWRARNRKTTALVAYDASSETQEAGVDYGYRTRLNGGAWSGYTYVSALTANISVGAVAGTWEVEVWSRRDGLLSRTGDRCSVTVIVPAGGVEHTARYWRFYNTARRSGTDGYTEISRLRMYNDGVQLNLTGATVTQSSNYGSRFGSNVVKATENYAGGNSEDTWTTATGSAMPQWIVIDAGAPITADLMMYYYGGDTVSFSHRAPYAYQFQKSDDGLAWTDVVVEAAGPATDAAQYKPFV